jgi:hypothetical protein
VIIEELLIVMDVNVFRHLRVIEKWAGEDMIH